VEKRPDKWKQTHTICLRGYFAKRSAQQQQRASVFSTFSRRVPGRAARYINPT
jgi:hypothetical protein